MRNEKYLQLAKNALNRLEKMNCNFKEYSETEDSATIYDLFNNRYFSVNHYKNTEKYKDIYKIYFSEGYNECLEPSMSLEVYVSYDNKISISRGGYFTRDYDYKSKTYKKRVLNADQINEVVDDIFNHFSNVSLFNGLTSKFEVVDGETIKRVDIIQDDNYCKLETALKRYLNYKVRNLDELNETEIKEFVNNPPTFKKVDSDELAEKILNEVKDVKIRNVLRDMTNNGVMNNAFLEASFKEGLISGYYREYGDCYKVLETKAVA